MKRKLIGLSIFVALSLNAYAFGFSFKDTYSENGLVLIKNLDKNDKYTRDGVVYKKYENDEDKLKDIDKNFMNFLIMEINHPHAYDKLYNSMFKTLKVITEDKDIKSFNDNVKILNYKLLKDKNYEIKDFYKLIDDIELTKKLELDEKNGLKSRDLFKILGKQFKNKLKEDYSNIEKIDQRYFSYYSLSNLFSNNILRYEDIKDPSINVQSEYLISDHMWKKFKKNRLGEDDYKLFPNFEEAVNNVNNDNFLTKVKANSIKQANIKKFKNKTSSDKTDSDMNFNNMTEYYSMNEFINYYERNYGKYPGINNNSIIKAKEYILILQNAMYEGNKEKFLKEKKGFQGLSSYLRKEGVFVGACELIMLAGNEVTGIEACKDNDNDAFATLFYVMNEQISMGL